MRIHTQKRARGFTLIEIMVSLFLFGLVVMAVYSSWMAIIKGTRTGLNAAAEVQRSRMAVRTLENALMCTRSFAADLDYYSFVGENGSKPSLSFVARLPKAFPRSGKFGDFNVRRLTFSLEAGSSGPGKLFVLRQNPILMDLDDDEKEFPVVLARNVKEFSIEFWDKKAEDWTDEWTETNQIPLKVKVTLQFAPDSSYTSAKEDVTRIISLPSVMVQAAWQMPGYAPPPKNNNLQMNPPGQVNPSGQQ